MEAEDPVSTWQILILLLMILAPVGIAALVVRQTNSTARMGRRDFAIRVLGLMLLAVLVASFLDGLLGGLASLLIVIAAVVLEPYWAIERQNDMGVFQKYRAVLVMAPVVGLIYQIYLMVAPPAPGRIDSSD